MKVNVNNVEVEVADNATIIEIPQLLGFSSLAGLAIAVNESIVPRSQWDDYKLQSTDRIILIRATQGG